MREETDPLSAMQPFFGKGLITDVLYLVKSGKEATVYCCRAHPSTGVELLAAKLYRPRDDRSFKNDAVYQEGRYYGKGRESRAVKKKTRLGREVAFGTWVYREWDVLNLLYRAGAAVPRPWAQASGAILMEYAGDEGGPAPMLHHLSLQPEEARRLYDLVLDNVALWLRYNIVHADHSPYNILYQKGRSWVIDFPQAVDARSNPNARMLLGRDVSNVCAYFARYGLVPDPARIAARMWGHYSAGGERVPGPVV